MQIYRLEEKEMGYDIERFRAVLKRLIGDEKQVSFARTHGVSPEHLSRLLRADTVSRPSKDLLKKLSGGSQLDLSELLEACGYENDALQESLYTSEERARINAEEIRENMTAMTKYCRVYKNLAEYLNEYIMLHDKRGAAFKIGAKTEYDGEGHFDAEYVAPIAADFVWGERTCRIWAALYFSETRGGKVIVLDAAIDGASLAETSAVSAEKMEEVKTMPFLYRIQDVKGMEVQGRFLKTAFKGDKEKIPYTYIGFGIDFFPDEFSEIIKTGFIAIHAESLGDASMLEKGLRNDGVEKVISELNKALGTGKGFGNIIAEVMSRETGLPFRYYESAEKERKSAVIISQEEKNKWDINELGEVVRKYAGMLGLKEFGECAVFSYGYLQTENRFQT